MVGELREGLRHVARTPAPRFLVAFTSTSVPVALAAVTVSGLPGAVAVVVTTHRMQTSVPDAVRGRVSAVGYAGDALDLVVGALIAPAVVALADLGVALRVLSAATLGRRCWRSACYRQEEGPERVT